ncbi:MAG: hypothetical protein V4612_01060 [Pseudomonadota bacterium]
MGIIFTLLAIPLIIVVFVIEKVILLFGKILVFLFEVLCEEIPYFFKEIIPSFFAIIIEVLGFLLDVILSCFEFFSKFFQTDIQPKNISEATHYQEITTSIVKDNHFSSQINSPNTNNINTVSEPAPTLKQIIKPQPKNYEICHTTRGSYKLISDSNLPYPWLKKVEFIEPKENLSSSQINQKPAIKPKENRAQQSIKPDNKLQINDDFF